MTRLHTLLAAVALITLGATASHAAVIVLIDGSHRDGSFTDQSLGALVSPWGQSQTWGTPTIVNSGWPGLGGTNQYAQITADSDGQANIRVNAAGSDVNGILGSDVTSITLNFDAAYSSPNAFNYFAVQLIPVYTNGDYDMPDTYPSATDGQWTHTSFDIAVDQTKVLKQIDVKWYWKGGTPGDSAAYLDNVTLNINTVPVPEPTSLMLLGLTATGLMARRRHRS